MTSPNHAFVRSPTPFPVVREARPAVAMPSYRLHKASGPAVVTLSGRDVYLGAHGSSESQAEYRRVLAE